MAKPFFLSIFPPLQFFHPSIQNSEPISFLFFAVYCHGYLYFYVHTHCIFSFVNKLTNKWLTTRRWGWRHKLKEQKAIGECLKKAPKFWSFEFVAKVKSSPNSFCLFFFTSPWRLTANTFIHTLKGFMGKWNVKCALLCFLIRLVFANEMAKGGKIFARCENMFIQVQTNHQSKTLTISWNL